MLVAELGDARQFMLCATMKGSPPVPRPAKPWGGVWGVEFDARPLGVLALFPRRFFVLGSVVGVASKHGLLLRDWWFGMQGVTGRGPCGVVVRDVVGMAGKRGLRLGDRWFEMQGIQGVGLAGLRFVGRHVAQGSPVASLGMPGDISAVMSLILHVGHCCFYWPRPLLF